MRAQVENSAASPMSYRQALAENSRAMKNPFSSVSGHDGE
jgi:hypothetical protein